VVSLQYKFGDLGKLFSFHQKEDNILLCLSMFKEFTDLSQVHLDQVVVPFIFP